MNTFEELFAAVDGDVKENRSDLTEYDRKEIDLRPGQPFIHYARRFGTSIMFFPHPNWSEWPTDYAERERLLGHQVKMARKFAGATDILKTHRFDGVILHSVSRVRAKFIAEEYAAKIRDEWKSGQQAIV